ncbi:MAG: zinc-dependent alcohol dehydrogenase family protein [Gammaproteobacteria bacterium]|nr:zinc-dependent alcohol dehydrogenase family protein [Gammaproteobacteria bacterium]
MRAAAMEAVNEPLVVRDLPDPTLEPHGAIVRVEANGVCRSDWHAWVGDWKWIGVEFDFPHVMGHEFCGVVEESGTHARRFKPGDRVIVPFSQGEGTCEHCLAGHSNVCDNRLVPGFSYWGGFGRYSHVPHADFNLVAMPDSLDFNVGAALGCRYMTSFYGVAERAKIGAGEWVAVYGCGGIGLAAVQIATALGANVIGVDVDPEKLKFATDIGAVDTVLAANQDPVEAVLEITKGGAHVAIDALGIKTTCQNAMRSLRTRGRHLQIGQTGHDEQGMIEFPIDVMLGKSLTVVATNGMPAARYGTMLNMIEAGKLNPQKLITRNIPLEQAGTVLASMNDYKTLGFVVIDRY